MINLLQWSLSIFCSTFLLLVSVIFLALAGVAIWEAISIARKGVCATFLAKKRIELEEEQTDEESNDSKRDC
jgi:hypothetical protein